MESPLVLASPTGGILQLKFCQRDDVPLLLTSERCTPVVPKVSSKRQRRRYEPPFATMTMSSAQPSCSNMNTSSSSASHTKVPMFMIASVAETKSSNSDGNKSAPAWRFVVGNLLAGAVSGCAVEAALYPIDTIKTRMQAMIGGGGVKALLQSGGGRGLYAGIWGNLAGVAPASAIFISVYEPIKKFVQSSVPEERQYLGPIVAGASAGLASSLIRVPTEVIKSRLQTKEFAGPIQAVRAILTREGARGLYAGYGAFLLRDLPFDALEFVAYEQLKRNYSILVKRELSPGETSIVGAIAGGFTGIVTTPLDVLKTRLMTQGASGRYTSLLDATLTIAREEGMAAFMRGWQPRLIWISMGGFVFFPVLEASKKFFAPQTGERMQVTPLAIDGK
ncbi:hypothetical protein CEUSTIGMA_g10126.t1 [Chlamydomonas eustigma]|uniref:Uncharacterized protein n=1 Tax=Chlamydomonas eustigma TaxID=1157962 RepID=A0A250XIS6_9CHLO|nr:hypothetical protein CEUSTIGMA_g10126.t1 [Chlamydomonas eustigma]|eukprot:GAX82700.1 hypothetical protein CEUSTIGMA_g10126.t1 [Chlamydomonas eustigma]